MTMRDFFDSGRTGETVTRRSRTELVIFLNNAPIYWFSKKQISIETFSFVSGFVAMKKCCEFIRGLRYKLSNMGIIIDEPSFGGGGGVISLC